MNGRTYFGFSDYEELPDKGEIVMQKIVFYHPPFHSCSLNENRNIEVNIVL